MIAKLYLLYGLVVVGLMGTAEYRGWRLTSFNKTVLADLALRDVGVQVDRRDDGAAAADSLARKRV